MSTYHGVYDANSRKVIPVVGVFGHAPTPDVSGCLPMPVRDEERSRLVPANPCYQDGQHVVIMTGGAWSVVRDRIAELEGRLEDQAALKQDLESQAKVIVKQRANLRVAKQALKHQLKKQPAYRQRSHEYDAATATTGKRNVTPSLRSEESVSPLS